MKDRVGLVLPILVCLCGSDLSEIRSAQLSGPTRVREVTRQGEARVWIVDSAGGGDFLDLPPAVAAARSGDLIAVRESGSTYGGFTTSKGLTIVGMAGPVPTCGFSGPGRPCVGGRVLVEDLPAGEELVLRGLNLNGQHTASLVVVDSCAGVVWVEDCPVRNRVDGSLSFYSPRDQVQVLSSHGVVWIRSPVEQEGYLPLSFAVSDGLQLDDSTLFAFESSFDGGGGSPVFGFPNSGGSAGGDGARLLTGSSLFASGSSFHGGSAGHHTCFSFDGALCGSGGPAGDGVRAGVTSQGQVLDSSATGGNGTPAKVCLSQTCPATPPGSPSSGAVTDLELPARRLEVESPVVAGGSYRLTVVGQPGETVFTAYSDHADATWVPLYFGPQLTAHPIVFVLEGVIPAGGTFERDVPVPPVNLLTRFHRSFVQGLLFDELANAYLTSGSVLVVLGE